jgi:hypothetical protein
MRWNEADGQVSRAFEDWKWSDRENRAFLRLSAQWSSAAYKQAWTEAQEDLAARFDPDRHYGDEYVDLFDHAVDGLWPTDYSWITEASVLKNGVTAFEVYLEKSLQEVLTQYTVTIDDRPHKIRLEVPGKFESPGWKTLVKGHAALGSTIESDEVVFIRDLRHLLTHQHGELRTESSLEKFRDRDAEQGKSESERANVGGRVWLGAPRVVKILDCLAAVIRQADVKVWSLRGDARRKEDGRKAIAELHRQKCLSYEPA